LRDRYASTTDSEGIPWSALRFPVARSSSSMSGGSCSCCSIAATTRATLRFSERRRSASLTAS